MGLVGGVELVELQDVVDEVLLAGGGGAGRVGTLGGGGGHFLGGGAGWGGNVYVVLGVMTGYDRCLHVYSEIMGRD